MRSIFLLFQLTFEYFSLFTFVFYLFVFFSFFGFCNVKNGVINQILMHQLARIYLIHVIFDRLT